MRRYVITCPALAAIVASGCKPADTTQTDRSPQPAKAAPPTVRPASPARSDTASGPTPAPAAEPATDVNPDAEPEVVDPVLARGKAAFRAGMCFKCHRDDATGSARAPNLTDDEWVHCDGSVEGILGVLRSGVPEEKFVDPSRPFPMNPVTGLVPDEEDLRALATFVHSLSSK